MAGGVGLAFAGMAWLSRLGPSTQYFPQIALPMMLLGSGIGTALIPLTAASIEGVDQRDAGAASGLVNVAQQIGAAIGLAVMVTIFGAATRSAIANAVRAARSGPWREQCSHRLGGVPGRCLYGDRAAGAASPDAAGRAAGSRAGAGVRDQRRCRLIESIDRRSAQMPRSRGLRDIPGIGVDKVGDAADAAHDPRFLRLENLDTDLRPPAGRARGHPPGRRRRQRQQLPPVPGPSGPAGGGCGARQRDLGNELRPGDELRQRRRRAQRHPQRPAGDGGAGRRGRHHRPDLRRARQQNPARRGSTAPRSQHPDGCRMGHRSRASSPRLSGHAPRRFC